MADKIKVQLPSTIESVSTRKDNTLKLVISTQELSGEEKAKLMDLHNKYGWLLFSEDELTQEDIPEEKPEFGNMKSDSQRLRNVLYVYWEKIGKKGDFEHFKRRWYNNKIEQIKLSIDEL